MIALALKDKLKAKKSPAGYTYKKGPFQEPHTVSGLLNWAAIDRKLNVVLGKDASVFSVINFRGPDMASSTQSELVQFMAQLNGVIKELPTGFVLYFDAQRHKADKYDHARASVPLGQMMDDERADYYEGGLHYETNFFLTIFQEPLGTMKQKVFDSLYEDPEKDMNDPNGFVMYAEYLKKFCDRRDSIISVLSKIMPEVYVLNDVELATYLHNTVSPERHLLFPDPMSFLSDYVFDGEKIIGGSKMRIGKKHIRIVTVLTTFPPYTSPGFLDALNRVNIEYRWVSRYICLSKIDAQKELEQVRKNWSQTIKGLVTMIREAITKSPDETDINEHAIENTQDVATALLELNADSVAYGYYTMTIQVDGDTDKEVDDKAARIKEILQTHGFSAYVEGVNTLDAWFGSLPGHFRANVRRATVSSITFSHLLPVTAMWPGDVKNFFLKGPVLLYTDTVGYTPFRLNLHVGDVGHTMVVGPSGAGKSVLLNTIEAHFMKYPEANVFIFDKAASSRALTMAMGGNFYNIAAEGEKELSFQPLADIEDENEMRWARQWILSYVKMKNVEIGPLQERHVWEALKSLVEFPKEMRTITTYGNLVQDLPVRTALTDLMNGGPYGKLFDNNKDVAGVGRWQTFEMETIMGQAEAVPPTLDYLFHRIERQISHAKGPSIIVMDECWLFLSNETFAGKMKEYFKDMRKKNTSIIIATQNLSDIARAGVLLDVVKEQCQSKIYLPNVNASTGSAYKLYEEFGLNAQQISLIRQMRPKQDYYYSSQRGNRIFALALRASEAAFVTATNKTDQQAMDALLKKYPEISEGNRDIFIREWFRYKGMDEEWLLYLNKYQKRKGVKLRRRA